MNRIDDITSNHDKLNKKYKALVEQAYNFRQTDSALSDISEYKAIKLLYKTESVKILYREPQKTYNLILLKFIITLQ